MSVCVYVCVCVCVCVCVRGACVCVSVLSFVRACKRANVLACVLVSILKQLYKYNLRLTVILRF